MLAYLGTIYSLVKLFFLVLFFYRIVVNKYFHLSTAFRRIYDDEFFAFSILSIHVAIRTNLQNHLVLPAVVHSLFNQRMVNVWNSLPRTVDFTSLTSFKRTINDVDYSDFLKVFSF